MVNISFGKIKPDICLDARDIQQNTLALEMFAIVPKKTWRSRLSKFYLYRDLTKSCKSFFENILNWLQKVQFNMVFETNIKILLSFKRNKKFSKSFIIT